MKELEFSVHINANKEMVWATLWQDETFRKWAGMIDPGTYMVGTLQEGNVVEYISAENGYGVTSKVEKLIMGEYLLLRHSADTQEKGKQLREKEWTGGKESYTLEEVNGTTTLTVAFDVPLNLEDEFGRSFPKALDKVKELAEHNG